MRTDTHTHTYTHTETVSFWGFTNTSNQLTNQLSGKGQYECLHIQDVTSLQNTAVPLWLIAMVNLRGIALVTKPFLCGPGLVDERT